MARIPTAADVRQVQPTQLRQVRVTDAAAGLDVHRANQERGQALGRIGSMLEKEAVRVRDEEDVASSRQATTEYAKAVQKLNYGDPNDPNSGTGHYSLRGQAALEARPAYEEKLGAEYQRIAESLPSKGARLRFEQAGTARKMRALENGATFANRQRELYSKAMAEGERAQLINDAIADPHNNRDYLTAIAQSVRAQMHKDIGDPANATGADREKLHKMVEAAVTDAQTAAHMGAIDTLLSSGSATSAADAEAYFNANKAGIAADKRDDVERALEDQTLLEKTKSTATASWRKPRATRVKRWRW